MNIVRAVFVLLLLSAPVVASASTTIAEPYEAEGFSCAGLPDGCLLNEYETRGYGRFRIAADLNFDGSGDLILTPKADGNCGSRRIAHRLRHCDLDRDAGLGVPAGFAG